MKKFKGSGFLVVSVVSALMLASAALSITKINQVLFSGFDNSKSIIQAQQYAEAEAAVVKATAYSDLAARSKANIQNSAGYKSEILVSSENDYSDEIKQRIVTINVYKEEEAQPRYSLNVMKISADVEASVGVVPIGTVIAWPVNTLPIGVDVWLECNGQSCSAYPELVAVLGKSTVPDYRNKFLEGHTTAGTSISAGVPNVIGTFPNGSKDNNPAHASGAFYLHDSITSNCGKSDHIYPRSVACDFSIVNSIYGNSSTVQPPAMTVKFLIKAS